MKFRQHRGSLRASMETVAEFASKEELFNYINEKWNGSLDDLKFEHCGNDTRTGWDTYYVLAHQRGADNFFVAGMSDGTFDPKE